MGKSGGWWPAKVATAPFIQIAGREDSALLRCDVTADKEEKDWCKKLHSIIQEYGLDGECRWLVASKRLLEHRSCRELEERSVHSSDTEMKM